MRALPSHPSRSFRATLAMIVHRARPSFHIYGLYANAIQLCITKWFLWLETFVSNFAIREDPSTHFGLHQELFIPLHSAIVASHETFGLASRAVAATDTFVPNEISMTAKQTAKHPFLIWVPISYPTYVQFLCLLGHYICAES